MSPYQYEIVDGVDCIFEEVGNQFNAFRKVKWGENGNPHLELRRWRVQPDGTEQAAKGMTFLSDNGPSDLAELLVKLGYGETKELLRQLNKRSDFDKALKSINDGNDNKSEESSESEEKYFDPKDIINGVY